MVHALESVRKSTTPTLDLALGTAQTKDLWQSDAIEAISPSICTPEFEDHKPLYD